MSQKETEASSIDGSDDGNNDGTDSNGDTECDIGGVHLQGGTGQMNTVYSWGTCRNAGIVTNCGREKID